MARKDSIDAGVLISVFFVGVVLAITLVILGQTLYFIGVKQEFEEKELGHTPTELLLYRVDQEGQLEGDFRLLEKKADGTAVVRVPIDTAMGLVVKELNKDGR